MEWLLKNRWGMIWTWIRTKHNLSSTVCSVFSLYSIRRHSPRKVTKNYKDAELLVSILLIHMQIKKSSVLSHSLVPDDQGYLSGSHFLPGLQSAISIIQAIIFQYTFAIFVNTWLVMHRFAVVNCQLLVSMWTLLQRTHLTGTLNSRDVLSYSKRFDICIRLSIASESINLSSANRLLRVV